MEFLPDGAQVGLRKRMPSMDLHADEDAVGVSLSPHRASLNTAWRLHRVRRGGVDYLLLHSAAYGRYLALSPQLVSLVYPGHAAVQSAYDAADAPEQVDVLWEAVRVADDATYVTMLHVSNRLLRATPWNPALPVVEAIALRQAPPAIPGPTEQLPRGVMSRTILYMQEDSKEEVDPLSRRTYGFSGRSLFHMMLCDLAGHGPCTEIGFDQGTILNFPCVKEIMNHSVNLRVGSGLATCERELDLRRKDLAGHGFSSLSGMDIEDIGVMSIFLARSETVNFLIAFKECTQRVDMSLITEQKSYREFIGIPLEQTVKNTCAIVSATKCVEIHHKWVYETLHGANTFPCIVAAPRKLRSACRRKGYWNMKQGAYVRDVLLMIKQIGGVRTTSAPAPAPFFLPLNSWQQHKWSTGGALSVDHIKQLLDTCGPVVGSLWVCPWYHLFNAGQANDLVYRSGCARNEALQLWSMTVFREELVGRHAVFCFEYRVRGNELEVLVLDNHALDGPLRWIHFYELDEIHTITVERIDPPLHLGGRTIIYPQRAAVGPK